jgi:Tfp pilus assembly protein PilN
MRPVNLIPAEDRRGDRAPMRTGATSYVLLGALALGLIGIIAVALTSKQISDRESEVTRLQSELAAATVKADSLRAFTDFRAIQQSRTTTIASLAQSRFDWERVLNELALVIPSNVWLLKMTGTVNPAVQLEEGAEIQARSTVPGPALEIIGCGPDQDAVAGFIASLEDIDGVTRVGLASSSQSDQEESGGDVTAGAATGQKVEDCRTESFIYQFEIVVAFDAVPAPETATVSPGVPPSPGAAPAAGQPASSTGTAGTTAEQTAAAQEATNLVPGG